MKLEEKICDRKIAYLLRQNPEIAFELALLYLVLGKRRNASDKIKDACVRSIYWLRKAGIENPEYVKNLSPNGQLREIEKILVFNKAGVDARLLTAIELRVGFALA